MRGGDTIVALSSGTLPCGVAVVRMSGPATRTVLAHVAGDVPAARKLALRSLAAAGQHIDRGLVVFFPGPDSFSGEDCAELHVHGSNAVVRALVRTLCEFDSVRLAEAGEFTRRAFENGKLDLTEVEGLGDLIAAETESQRAQALARMEGGLSDRLEDWRIRFLDLRAEIEARLDFSDESDVGDELPVAWHDQLAGLEGELAQALGDVGRGRIVREGFRVALAGPPNAGKSSLLNALAKSDLAIVSDEAGTTRDVREVPLDLDGQLVIFVDMAGLRESDSKAEAEGVRRAANEITRADLVLWLSAPDTPEDVENPVPDGGDAPVWRVATKVDLGTPARPHDHAVSVVSGTGMSALTAALSAAVADRAGHGEPVLVSRERDRAALGIALEHLQAVRGQLESPELAAESLRLASDGLARLLGRMDTEQVLDRLFSHFCIGK